MQHTCSIYPLGIFFLLPSQHVGQEGEGEGESRARVQHPGSLVDKGVLHPADPAPQALHSPSW